MTPPRLSAPAAQACRRVLELLAARLGMDVCMLAVKVGDQHVVLDAVDSAFGAWDGLATDWSDALCSVMADGRGPSAAPDLLDEAAYRELVERRSLQVRAYMGTALRNAEGELIGSLCAFDHAPQGDAMQRELALMETFGLVLSNLLAAELFAPPAKGTTHHDALTGVRDRQGWHAALQVADRWCRSTDQDAAVFAIDINDLKAVNERHGHAAGDALLQRAAVALTDAALRCVPGRDVVGRTAAATDYTVARTGGDEFAVLLPRCGASLAAHVVLELREALQQAGVSATVGHAVRHPVRGLAAACRDAEDALRALQRRRESLRALPSPRRAGDGAGPVRSTAPAAAGESERHTQSVDRLLKRVRELFGLETAFVSRLEGEMQTFVHINTSTPLPISVGDQRPRTIALCQHVLDGLLPVVLTDAAAHPVSAGIDVVQAGLVRTYLTVPIRLSDGELYGTLCCLSSAARPDLTDQAAAALTFAAEQVGELLERQRDEGAERARTGALVDHLLAGDGLRMALQPIVDIRSGVTVGVEALARFADGRPPEEWFTDAAVAGQLSRLELAAFDAALTLPIPAGAFLAVNLSPAVVMSEELQRRLAGLARTDVQRLSRLVIELTEHEQVTDYAALAAATAPYRSHGLKIAVDDAGAGHSSLQHVLQLCPDLMKLDRQLITALDHDPIRRALVASLRLFCTDSGIGLIAEGVETEAEARALRQIGVTLGQGFHLARAVIPT